MRVAALYDIHGNLPALEAVLNVVRQEQFDRIVVGGDVLPGPMPVETMSALLSFEVPTRFIHGNGELAVLAQITATDDPSTVSYWGTSSGEPLSEQQRPALRWTAQQVHPQYSDLLSTWPKTLRLTVAGLGNVLFCHGTPRSEVEIVTSVTPEDQLLPILDGLGVDVVVCGHTHMQFDRNVGRVRLVNAGSVGMPFGDPGAYWLQLGPEIQLRYTPYDFQNAAERVRGTEYPQAHGFAERSILTPPSANDVLDEMERRRVINMK
jgi:predicted phosphodiesterase